ncbi:hypothetical protein LY76DRAFT_166743 [Colletotrichum caudatum]|nr:hypothetical protein LY76DRAFT_166743 [Colletotrichum caudatum]
MLAMAGFNVESIRSYHSEAERSVSVKRFTESGSGVEVLVANTNVSLNGLDLQDECHNGAFVGIEWSINTHIQRAGRLVRLGQKHPVIFHILKVKDTYYDYIERNIIRYAITHEIIRNYINLRFNWLSWCDGFVKSGTISEYHAAKTIQRGHFYSFIAV